MHDVIVIGAGVAGLQCARRLAGSGAFVLIVDRSDTPGGRCATRSFAGQPADYGPLFIHGRDARFLAAVQEAAGSQCIPDWPVRKIGRGSPCQPDAYAPNEIRLALAGGINAFPRALATGVDSSCRRRSSRSSPPGAGWLSLPPPGSGGRRATSCWPWRWKRRCRSCPCWRNRPAATASLRFCGFLSAFPASR